MELSARKSYLYLIVTVVLFSLSIFFNMAYAGAISSAEKEEVRSSLDQFSSFAYAIDPDYNVDAEDKAKAKSNPNTKFALGLGLNPKYKITNTDKEFAYENPNTFFAYALGQSSNFKLSSNDRRFIKDNPSTLFSFGLTRNPNNKTTKKVAVLKDSESGEVQDSESILPVRNFKKWLSEKNIEVPGIVSKVYGFCSGIVMAPFNFLNYNFELFDFLDKPISQWTGWTIIHIFVTLTIFSFFIGILLGRPPVPRQTMPPQAMPPQGQTPFTNS